MKKLMTLCIVHQPPKVLLGMKKCGFGEGKWNGFGGKVLDGEEISVAAIRELREESGIEVREVEEIGVLDFEFRDNPARNATQNVAGGPEILEVHIFKARDFSGELRESEEMNPEWFHVDELPYELMWPDDRHWFPLFLADTKFRGKFLFDENNNIIEYNLDEDDFI